jgi:integrase
MGHIRDRWKDPARKGKGRRWQVKYQVDGRERDGGTYDNKEVAKRKLVELEGAVHRGQWIDPTDKTTVAVACWQYANSRPHAAGTAQRVAGYIRNHIEPTDLGSRRLAAVKASEAQMWVTERSAVLAPTTVRAMLKFVRSVYAAAKRDNQVATSPFDLVTLPRYEQERIVPLAVDQVRALADTMLPKYRAMVITQAGLGLRIGELLALRTEDVNFLARIVRVEDQIDKRTRKRVPPKTPRSRRPIPLPDVVSLELAKHIQQRPPGPDGLLFHTADGMPYWHEYYTQKVFAVAVRKVHKDWKARGMDFPADVTTHDLRHHFACELLVRGVSVIEVAELLGHEDASLVVSTYGHVVQGFEDRARKAIDAAWNAPDEASSEAVTAQGRPR